MQFHPNPTVAKRIILNFCGIAAAALNLDCCTSSRKISFPKKKIVNSFALSFYKVIVNGQKRCCLADKAEDVFNRDPQGNALAKTQSPFCIAQRKPDLYQNRSPWVPVHVSVPPLLFCKPVGIRVSRFSSTRCC